MFYHVHEVDRCIKKTSVYRFENKKSESPSLKKHKEETGSKFYLVGTIITEAKTLRAPRNYTA